MRSCISFMLQGPNEDELTNKILQYQEKGTEVDERTAELYSKQGNTDITELKGKVLQQVWFNSAGVVTRKKTLKGTTAQVMIR